MDDRNCLNLETFSKVVAHTRPQAVAFVEGNDTCPDLEGMVRFYSAAQGTLVVAEFLGLPKVVAKNSGGEEPASFFAFHIHEGEACGEPGGENPFPGAGGHFNPEKAEHPLHAGDLPPLLGNHGYAYLSVFTERFTPEEIMGKTVVVHQHGEDFHSQPSGNAGTKLACGTVQPVLRR